MHQCLQLLSYAPRIITPSSVIVKHVEQCAHIDNDGLKLYTSLEYKNVHTPQLKSDSILLKAEQSLHVSLIVLSDFSFFRFPFWYLI